MLNFSKFEVITFDCYGTLIDWENGILSAVKPVLNAHNVSIADKELLELYAKLESDIESGEYMRYSDVLRGVMKGIAERFDFSSEEDKLDCIVNSLKNWLPFPDTVEVLEFLKSRFKLAIISNIDDELFNFTARHLKVEFDWIITAEQVKSYKPSLNNFKVAIERIGKPADKILHVAQSIYHDIVPAKKLGLATVWVNRRKDKEGFGATPAASATPDLEVSDLRMLKTLIQSKL